MAPWEAAVPQVLDYPAIDGKPWEWHLVLFKDWLDQVEQGSSDRKYLKWLRARKVFDRKFIRYAEALLGVDRGSGRPAFDEVGAELAEELEKSRARQRSQAEQAGKFEAPAPPSAESDPFLRALLERFCELNPYLCMFGFKELADDFLAPHEIFRRVGTNDFEGRRPTMPQFQGWVQWLEWLGGIKKVGFRCKATKAGLEVGAYLKEMPGEELFADDVDIYADAEGQPAAPAPAAPPPPAPRPEPGEDAEPGLDEDDLLEEEGLDLPPEPEVEADPDVEPYWKTAVERPGSAAAAVVPAPTPAAVPADPADPVHRWLDDGAGPALTAAAAGLSLDPSPAGRAASLFELLTLASLLEGQAPADEALALFRALREQGALSRFFAEGGGLEELLQVCWQRGASPRLEERLVHLPRYRQGLARLAPAALDEARDARGLGRLLREQVSGSTLGKGLAFVIRELAQAGFWSGDGLDAASWLAWAL